MKIITVNDLIKSIKGFDPDQPVVFQVVAGNGTAWNMSELTVFKLPGENDMVGITMRHPDLRLIGNDNWINVKERLPDHTKYVLVCGDNKAVRGGHYSGGKWQDPFGTDATIEFWQEYPEPPNN